MTAPDPLAELFEPGGRRRGGEDAPTEAERAARARRRRRARRAGVAFLVVFAVLAASVTGYVMWALNAPLPDPVATTRTPTAAAGAAASFTLPAEGTTLVVTNGAAEFIGADGLTLAAGGDEPRSIASVSKIITALVVLDAHPLAGPDDPGPTITFTEADHDLYDEYYVQGAAIAAMPTGSSMPLRDALALMLIPSASNYADAVSTCAFGSRGAFLAATRDWLARQGLTGTTIVEPTGLSPRNVSTPSDLVRIGQLAAAHPTIAALAGSATYTTEVTGRVNNTNRLLGDSGVTGLKTGNLGEGTFALLFTATVPTGVGEPLSVTGVTLGGTSRESQDAAVRALLGSIADGFHDVALAPAGTAIGIYETAWGASAELVIVDSASIRTWSDTPIEVTTDIGTPVAYTDGEHVGTVTWTAGPRSAIASVQVRGTIEEPTGWWRLTHPQLLG
ncbi:D-alanyl-D-alanine carboxypeptidase family protein [Microbacterium sp. bgisy203]|uniref:D-alanyl-D-alanine carboxypeptidase family protein n=1 Tax=Microbacterium sp. bgisy203 TaxID=3413799 RepID=UPI003D754D4F